MNHAGIYVWPSGDQLLLLKAGLQQGPAAVSAFQSWRSRVRLEADFSPTTARLLPLAYHNLHQLGVKDPLLQRMKGVYRHGWYTTQRLLHAVGPVVRELDRARIPMLLTKGVPMALAYYGNVALRPMKDVDIVVPAARLDDALGILARLDWRGDWPVAETRWFRHAVQRFGPGSAELDLHWRPMYESRPDDEHSTFFSRAEPLEFQGVTVLQPDPTHALFLTVVHGLRWNLETPVRWIADATTVLRSRGSDVDWERLHELAVSHRVVHRLFLGLSYIADMFAAPVPRPAIERLRATPRTLFEQFEARVALADDGSLRPSVFRNQLSWLAEYGRHTPARNPLSFALGYTHYIRYRLGLGGRRELFSRLARSVRDRLAATKDAAVHSGKGAL